MEPRTETTEQQKMHSESESASWKRSILALLLFPASLWMVNWVSHPAEADSGVYFWLVVLLLLVAAVSFFVHVLLWFHLGSVFLGARGSLKSSIRAVGEAFVRPALAAVGLVVLATIIFSLPPNPQLATTLRGTKLLIFLWALVNVVIQAKRLNAFSNTQVALFVAWWVGILGAGLFVFRMFA